MKAFKRIRDTKFGGAKQSYFPGAVKELRKQAHRAHRRLAKDLIEEELDTVEVPLTVNCMGVDIPRDDYNNRLHAEQLIAEYDRMKADLSAKLHQILFNDKASDWIHYDSHYDRSACISLIHPADFERPVVSEDYCG